MTEEFQDPRPIDLSPLDPLRDADRFDAAARSIVRHAMAARAARRNEGVAGRLANWSTPVLAAAALIIAASATLLVRSSRALSAPPSPTTVASAQTGRFGLSNSILALTQSRAEPTPAEVVAAFDARWSGSQAAP